MEQQKLPNATLSLVLGIISFIACCCSAGIGGLIFSGIALLLANKDLKLYKQEPELYSNYSQLNTARIIAIVGLILAVLSLAYSIYNIWAMGGWDAYVKSIQDVMEQVQNAQ
jgi:hypothetical protein